MAHRDPGIIRLAHWVPSTGFEATYDVIVGALLELAPSPRLNPPRRPRPDS